MWRMRNAQISVNLDDIGFGAERDRQCGIGLGCGTEQERGVVLISFSAEPAFNKNELN